MRDRTDRDAYMTIALDRLETWDVVWECERGQNIPLLVIAEPAYSEYNDGTIVLTRNLLDGARVSLFSSAQGGYGPKVYAEPQYGGELDRSIAPWLGIMDRLLAIVSEESRR